MELNQIPQNPNNWGNVADLLNENSGKIEAETAKLNNVTTKFKGYFSSSTALSAKWPSPLVGDVAWVGATYPGVVYRCNVAGTWLATTDVPSVATVNLSEYYKLSDVLDKLKLNVSTAQTLTNIGEMAWNTETETAELRISNEVTMSIGQELFVKAKNTETTSILNGTPVYISGAQGGLKQIKKASNLTDVAEKTIGLATQDITASASGIITTMGEVHGLNTSAFAEGSLIWLGANGTLTTTKPVDAPYHIIIGVCTRSHATEGSIFVSVKESYRAQIDQLRSDLNETTDKLTELESEVGNAESSWGGSTSTSHSSSVDGVSISIKKGEYFIVETKCSVESPAQIFAKYVGGLSEMLVATNFNKQHIFVAKENIEYIGIYHPALSSAVLVSLSVKSALSFTTIKNSEEIFGLDNDFKKISLNIGTKFEAEVPSASIQLSFNISLKKDEKYVLKLKAENVITKDAAVVSPLYGNSTASGNEISVHFVDGAEVVYTPKTDIDKIIFAVTNGAFISSGIITIQAYNYNSIAKDVASLSSGLDFTNKVYESSWEGSASTSHSSNSDGIVCFIPKNSSFIIETKCSVNSSAQVFVKYVGDANTTKILGTSFNKTNEFKATRAIEYVGVYHPALTSTSNVALLVTESKKYKIDELPYFTSNEIKSNGTVRFETITIPKGEKYTLKFDANGISKTEVSALYYNKIDDENLVGNIVNGSIISFEPKEDVNAFIFYVRVVSFISSCIATISVCKAGSIYEKIVKDGGVLIEDVKDNSFISAYCDVDIETKTREFAQLFNNATSEVEPFVYFTDPHVFFPAAYPKLKESIALLQKCYNSIAANFVLCGGDWLTNHNQKDALYYLSYTDGMMNKMFDRYYPMLGNHDNNYQGTTDDSEQIGSGIINNQSMINLWFGKYGKMYYSFDGTSTKFFVLDTGSDWTPDMDTYRWLQIDWLDDALKNSDKEHNVIAMHIFWNDGVTPMANNVTLLVNAFNSKTSVTLNGKLYDFANTTGKVHFIITGHVHLDRIETINNVPIYCTTQFKQNYTGQTTFDLILIDYGSKKLKSVRIGFGVNREMNLA